MVVGRHDWKPPSGKKYLALQQAQEKLTETTSELAQARSEEADNQKSQTIENQRQFEDQTKQTRAGAGGAGGTAEDFGRQLLSGIFDSLGLGNVLSGKSPLEWGATKMGLGALNWGLGVMKQFGLFDIGRLGGRGPGLGIPSAATIPAGVPVTGPQEESPFGPGR